MKAGEKIDCQQADEMLVDFLYGELNPVLRAAFEEHLAVCATHAEEVSKLTGLLDVVRADKIEQVPELVNQRIMRLARAADEQNRPRAAIWRRLVLSPIAAAAVLVGLVIAVGLSVHFGRRESTGTQPQTVSVLPAAAPGQKNLAVQKAERRPQEIEPAATEEQPRKQAPPALSGPALTEPRNTELEHGLYKKGKAAFRRTRPRVHAAGRKFKKKAPAAAAPPSEEKAGAFQQATATYGSSRQDKLKTIGEGGAQTGAVAKSDNRGRAAGGVAVGGAMSANDDRMKRPLRDFAKPPPPPAKTKQAELSKDLLAKREKTRRPQHVAAESPVALDESESGYEQQQRPAPNPAAAAESRRAAKKVSVAKQAGQEDLYNAGERELAAKRYRRAVSSFRAFIGNHPGDPRLATCRYRLAKALFLAGSCSEAVTAVERAIGAAPRHAMAAPALLDEASCHVRLGRFERARAAYRRIIRDYPDYAPEARRGLARIER